MKNMKKILFSFLAIGLFLIGTNVEAKTVAWDDLVNKLKEGRVVEEITNAKNNGENQEINVVVNGNEFKANMTVEGTTVPFILTYSDGVVSFNSDINVNTLEDAEFARLLDTWVEDVILFAGELYNYDSSEVVDLISRDDLDTLTLASDGIEIVKEDISYPDEHSVTINSDRIKSLKLNLVNGFGGLVETPECEDPNTPEPTPTPTNTPTPEETPIPEQPKEESKKEEVTNPSTGDIEVYQIVGGLVICMSIATGIAIHLRKKEEII